MAMDGNLAPALVGVLAGLIFFLDGWRLNPAEVLPFHKTPRITALASLIGGGVISGLLAYLSQQQQSQAMQTYVVWFALAVIGSLVLSGTLVVIYYLLKFYGQKPLRLLVADAIPFLASFLLEGLEVSLNRLREAERERDQVLRKLKRLERSRLLLLQFITHANDFLNTDLRAGHTGRNQFKFFLAGFLRLFVAMFFEEKEVLDKFRAAFFERQRDHLIFVEGADLKGTRNQYSTQSLDCKGSLAGRSLEQNRIFSYPEDSKEAFQTRPKESSYRRFVVVPVPFKPESTEAERIGVLCIDTREAEASFRGEFEHSLLSYFSNLIASAHTAYLSK